MTAAAKRDYGPTRDSDVALAELMLRRFRGRQEYVGVPNRNGEGFQPELLSTPLSPRRLAQQHLGQQRCHGLYLMETDNCVKCGCADFDNKPARPDPSWDDKAIGLWSLLVDVRLSPVLELSQSGDGAHVWLFMDQPVAAAELRALFRRALCELRLPIPEIYPRQDRLGGKGFGSMIRYPLWNRSKLVTPPDLQRGLPPLKVLKSVRPSTPSELAAAVGGLPADPCAPDVAAPANVNVATAPTVARLLAADPALAARWAGNADGLHDRTRSAIASSIACKLLGHNLTEDVVEAALREWCTQIGYDKGNRSDWIPLVVRGAREFLVARRTPEALISASLAPNTPDLIKRQFVAAARNRRARRQSRYKKGF